MSYRGASSKLNTYFNNELTLDTCQSQFLHYISKISKIFRCKEGRAENVQDAVFPERRVAVVENVAGAEIEAGDALAVAQVPVVRAQHLGGQNSHFYPNFSSFLL